MALWVGGMLWVREASISTWASHGNSEHLRTRHWSSAPKCSTCRIILIPSTDYRPNQLGLRQEPARHHWSSETLVHRFGANHADRIEVRLLSGAPAEPAPQDQCNGYDGQEDDNGGPHRQVPDRRGIHCARLLIALLNNDYKPGVSNRCKPGNPTPLIFLLNRSDRIDIIISRRKEKLGIIQFFSMNPLCTRRDRTNSGNGQKAGLVGRMKSDHSLAGLRLFRAFFVFGADECHFAAGISGDHYPQSGIRW